MSELGMLGGTSRALARPCPHQLDMTHLQRVQNELQDFLLKSLSVF